MGPTQHFIYNTPINEFATFYPNAERPFEKKISSHLPSLVVTIRAVAACALSALVVITTPVWVWPVAVAGVAFAGWTIYSNTRKKDPLVEAFYKIVGGKDKYEKLPEFKIKGKDSLYDKNFFNLNYDDLKNPLSKAITPDGRRILIVKALSRHPEAGNRNIVSKVKAVFVFVEKLKYEDFFDSTEVYLRFINNFLKAGNVFNTINDLERDDPWVSNGCQNKYISVRASISPELANELLAQQ